MGTPKCDHPKCRGTNHYPACSIYIEAMKNWELPAPEPKKQKGRPGRHDLKVPEHKKVPAEIRAEMSRRNGAKGGRPMTIVPTALLDVLRKGKFRVREEYRRNDEISNAASELAGWSLERLAFVAAGRVVTKKAPSVVKAAVQIREEICEPIVKAVQHSGSVDLGKVLDAQSVNAVTGPAFLATVEIDE